MPYLGESTTDKAQMMKPPPFGPGFTKEQAEQATTMEIWYSSFSDPGEDYNEFRLLDADGKVITKKVVMGY